MLSRLVGQSHPRSRPGSRHAEPMRLRAGSFQRLLLVCGAIACAWALSAASGSPDSMRPTDEGPVAEHACRFWAAIGSHLDSCAVADQLIAGTFPFKALGTSNKDGWGLCFGATALSAAGLEQPVSLRGGPEASHPYDARFDESVAQMLACRAEVAIAHVRAASSGHTGIPDPHPFVRGGVVFAHNGTIPTHDLLDLIAEDNPKYLDKHPPDYENPYIDSELYFLYVLETVERLRKRSVRTSLGEALEEAVLKIYDRAGVGTKANCVAFSGDTLYAVRFDHYDNSRYKIRYKQIDGGWTVCSEPVGSDTTDWSYLPPKSIATFPIDGQPIIRTIYPPAAPWIQIASTTIDDDSLGSSDGNGDGNAAAGETIEMDIGLVNEGKLPTSNVLATLSTSDTLVTVLQQFATYGEIQVGDTVHAESPLLVRIRSDVPVYHVVFFDYSIRAESGTETYEWQRSFCVPTMSPAMSIGAYSVDDGNDGHLEPGEDASISVSLENHGSVPAYGLQATLACSSSCVVITQGEASADSLGSGASITLEPPFEVHVGEDCPDPCSIPLYLDVEADWDIHFAGDIEMPVGGIAEHFEDGAGDWVHLHLMNGYGDQWHISSQRNHTPGGMFSWKCGAVDSGVPYDSLLDAALVSPELPLWEHTELRFWHLIRSELAMGHYGMAYDGALVEASVNGGAWQQIFPAMGYDFVIMASETPGPFPAETPVFAGYFGWRQATFEIDGYEGTVRFRFRFGSNGSEGLEGWYLDDVELIGSTGAAGVDTVFAVPLAPALEPAAPNPFTARTSLLLEVPRRTQLRVSVFDLEGRHVRTIWDGQIGAGRHRILWDGVDARGAPVPSGAYFIRLASPDGSLNETTRVVRVR